MAHTHAHPNPHSKNLGLAIALNIGITALQIVGGIVISSMALLTDALHNSMDVAALIISLAAIKLANRPSSNQHTFGYKRAETLASLINAITIVVVALIILFESTSRLFREHEPIQGEVMVWLAGIAVFINGFSAWLLYKGSKESLNMRSSFLHLVSDTLFSVAVVIGGLCIMFFQVYWIDSVLSLLIGLYLLYSSWPLISRGTRIIMQFSPPELDLEAVGKYVCSIEKVVNIHHIHVWELDEHKTHLEAHVELVKELTFSEVCAKLEEVESILKKEFNIVHVTLQPESGSCKDLK